MFVLLLMGFCGGCLGRDGGELLIERGEYCGSCCGPGIILAIS